MCIIGAVLGILSCALISLFMGWLERHDMETWHLREYIKVIK